MSIEVISLLVVQIITFLTTIVTLISTSNKASAERRDAAAERDRQFKQAQEDLKLKTQIDDERAASKARLDDERAERDRRWALEDRATAAEANRQMKANIEKVSKKADQALLAATNIMGDNVTVDPEPSPIPSRREAALRAARPVPVPNAPRTPESTPEPDFGAAELFPPGDDK